MTAKLIIVMGVSGTGKSTLAKSLADRLGFPFVDGDDHHPKGNIEKMSRGEALNDQDRLPWLGHLREIGIRKLKEEFHRNSNQSGGTTAAEEEDVGVVLACSSLKGLYRQILRGKLKVERAPEIRPEEIVYELREADQEIPPSSLPSTYFIWIKGDKETLRDRMLKRQGHFFKATMLDGQFEVLEPPEGEPGVVVVPLEPSTEEQTDITLEGLRTIARAEPATTRKS
ncbi:carbohydrate kinase [Thelephora ganbajun]|uniref:Carbohydrate kinase n=1 Tax=Thelephora ganbajun TaxID=370292 RepID=A0ACB6ZMU4_THEGA|nr:carbohydrate kinase [Thelephora ganbajun]